MRRALTASTIAPSSSLTTRTSFSAMPMAVQMVGDEADVTVLGAAGKDLVADDQHRRRYGLVRAHSRCSRRNLTAHWVPPIQQHCQGWRDRVAAYPKIIW